MDFQELLNTLANNIAFWQSKNDRYNVPVVNEARNVIRDTGRVADDFIGGGMGQAALRGPDALTRQLLLNAALTAGGEAAAYGIGKGVQAIAPKITPELAALRNYLTNQQVVLHGSPLSVEGNQLIPYAGSELSQDAANIFSIRPNRGIVDIQNDAIRDVMYYADTPFGSRGYFPKGMSKEEVANALANQQPTVVVGRTPKSNLVDAFGPNEGVPQGVYMSSKPIDILKTIVANPSFKSQVKSNPSGTAWVGSKYDEVMQALKKAGVGTKTEKLLAKIPKKK